MKFDVITTFNFNPSTEGCSSARAMLGFNEIYSSRVVTENVRERVESLINKDWLCWWRGIVKYSFSIFCIGAAWSKCGWKSRRLHTHHLYPAH